MRLVMPFCQNCSRICKIFIVQCVFIVLRCEDSTLLSPFVISTQQLWQYNLGADSNQVIIHMIQNILILIFKDYWSIFFQRQLKNP
jgi:hypothetical protein